MVLFPPLDDDQSVSKEGFGVRLYSLLQRDFISITCASNAWFQYPEMPDASHAIRLCTAGYGDVIAYGSSMGGYGALAFASAMGATKSIAIAPQFSVDPAKVQFENRWMKYRKAIPAFDHDDLPGRILNAGRSYVFYDPFYERDAAHAAIIAAAAVIMPVRVPLGGHLCGDLLARAGLLRPSVEDIIHDRFDAHTFAAALRARKKSLPRPWKMLAERATRDGHPTRAAWATQRLTELEAAAPNVRF